MTSTAVAKAQIHVHHNSLSCWCLFTIWYRHSNSFPTRWEWEQSCLCSIYKSELLWNLAFCVETNDLASALLLIVLLNYHGRSWVTSFSYWECLFYWYNSTDQASDSLQLLCSSLSSHRKWLHVCACWNTSTDEKSKILLLWRAQHERTVFPEMAELHPHHGKALPSHSHLDIFVAQVHLFVALKATPNMSFFGGDCWGNTGMFWMDTSQWWALDDPALVVTYNRVFIAHFRLVLNSCDQWHTAKTLHLLQTPFLD